MRERRKSSYLYSRTNHLNKTIKYTSSFCFKQSPVDKASVNGKGSNWFSLTKPRILLRTSDQSIYTLLHHRKKNEQIKITSNHLNSQTKNISGKKNCFPTLSMYMQPFNLLFPQSFVSISTKPFSWGWWFLKKYAISGRQLIQEYSDNGKQVLNKIKLCIIIFFTNVMTIFQMLQQFKRRKRINKFPKPSMRKGVV